MKTPLVAIALVLFLFCGPVLAAEKAVPAEKPAAKIAVAVLDFEAQMPGNPTLGADLAAVLTAVLSSEPNLILVEREALRKVLAEHELNLTGLVSAEQAVKIGRICGAKILVTGKAFPLGKDLMVTAKIIGTETTLVEGVLVRGKGDADIGDLSMQLATKVAERLRESGPKLIAQEGDAPDPMIELKKKLADRKLPTVAIVLTEEHRARIIILIIDPAVETELKVLMNQGGITVKDVEENKLADWATKAAKGNADTWPKSLEGVDYVITGQGFSEFAARIGNLYSCAARAEINVISRKDGKIVFADRETTRAVDLAEDIAGKKALQQAGHALGLRLIEYFAQNLPAAEKRAEK